MLIDDGTHRPHRAAAAARVLDRGRRGVARAHAAAHRRGGARAAGPHRAAGGHVPGVLPRHAATCAAAASVAGRGAGAHRREGARARRVHRRRAWRWTPTAAATRTARRCSGATARSSDATTSRSSGTSTASGSRRATPIPVFETDFGRIGMLVCADGRLPEIARSLALNGAQIIVDLTAWVSSARQRRRADDASQRRVPDADAARRRTASGSPRPTSSASRRRASSTAAARASSIRAGESSRRWARTRTAIADVRRADRGRGAAGHAPPELYDALTQPTESLPVVRTLDEAIVLPRAASTASPSCR